MRATLCIASLPLAAAALGFACGPASDPNDVGGVQYMATHAIKTAFVVLMENH
ncbi:MAG: hypothetical protein KIT84_19810 [Labilithrix sp.]|nr:hypothetical protein [Labilithrix sp.]MCW5813284.1 hypothetical protein [Labilithrix sp.]